ncbi:hypothetical protein OsJ_29578 [Oryza sativa Japonica Group]|uniref:Uncharacterized protein n=1 Tax=Oryza sativa subsp. japonica TaxID=39947 RepID=B9G3X9_ORYSJ|nr:hypothetical protein OsJ_29578 [Oryza sativa Japonica Group]
MDNFLSEEEQGEGSAGNCHGHDADVGCEEEEDQTCVDQMLRDGERFDTDDREYHKFTTRVKDSKTPVYNGCKTEHSKLQVVLSLLHLKNLDKEGLLEQLLHCGLGAGEVTARVEGVGGAGQQCPSCAVDKCKEVLSRCHD